MGKRRAIRFSAQALKKMDLSNKAFEEYYRSQLMLENKDFDQFIACMKTELPATFRITGFRQQSLELLSLLKENYLQSIIEHPLCESGDTTGEKVGVVPLDFYPGDMAWQINASRLAIRKSPELKKLQHFLVTESESGNLSRQEAVSMLPPLVLGVKEHHAILDLCAAPGSKSAQLVELLHADAESKCPDVGNHYAEPSGIVLANDFDRKRCYMMVHQVKRLQSPCVIVTEEDASVYPRIFIDSPQNPDELQQMLFDRILADVPCSGDGTLRKSPDIWLRWTPKIARGHHELQKRILRRGLELLRVPESPESDDLPRLVYSTCSLNPIEDEAVVAAVLEACKGTVRLVAPDLISTTTTADGNGKSASFIGRPGLSSWRVMMGADKWYSSLEEVPEKERGNLQASLFPPANVADLHLEHCRRILPHDQNTGGFFVAVLEKVGDLPWMGTKPKVMKRPQQLRQPQQEEAENVSKESKKEEEEPAHDNEDAGGEEKEVVTSPVPKKARLQESRRQESAFVYMDPATDKDWPTIREYYGISHGGSGSVAKLEPGQILYRAGATSAGDPLRRRNLYYTNPLVKRVIQANKTNKSVHVVSGGVKLFAVCDDKQFTGYRLLHDGAHLASTFLPRPASSQHPPQLCKRRISMTASERDDLLLLLREEMPLAKRLSEATLNQWQQLSVGPVLIDYDPKAPSDPTNPPDGGLLPHCRIAFAGWRGVDSLRHYIDRHERVHVLRLCGQEATVPMVTGRDKDSKQPPTETATQEDATEDVAA